MRRVQLLLDESTDDALEREAKRQRRSKSDLVREALNRHFKPLPPIEEDAIWKMAGVDSYEPVDIDEVVYEWRS